MAAWLGLNARSRLRYVGVGAAPTRGVRAVQLTGEAYCEVVPNPARPFVVSTTAARVRVTGTAFNVRAFAAENSVEVSMAHGRAWVVRLAVPTDSVLLTAGTQVALRALDAPGRAAAVQLRPRPPADLNFRAWQTDTLRFRETSVAQVARTSCGLPSARPWRWVAPACGIAASRALSRTRGRRRCWPWWRRLPAASWPTMARAATY